MSSTKLTSYNVLSVDNYTDKTLQDPYWATGDWSQCTPPQQYIHSHRYIGESILVLLENSGIIGHSGNNVSSDPIKVFNAGCGPAQVESYIHENKGDRQVEILSGDRDEVMLEEARRKYHLGKWVGNEIKIMDILNSGIADNTFTHVVLNFVVAYFSDTVGALREFNRLLTPGGLVAWATPQSLFSVPLIHAYLKTVKDGPPFPPVLPPTASNRIPTATTLLQDAGFEPLYVEDVEFDAPFENAKQAAESCAPVVMNLGRTWRAGLQAEVMRHLRDHFEEQYGQGEVVLKQKVLVAIGKKSA